MITKAELNNYPKFYIETTSKECFEIEKLEQGYKFTDITPPILAKVVSDINPLKSLTEKINKNPNYEFNAVDPTKILHFEGIGKGFSFAFYENEGQATVTKGKIEKLFIKQKIGNNLFNIHLFEPPGRKISLSTLSKDFIIHTDSQKLEIGLINDELFFENRKVHSIFSLFNVGKNPYVDPTVLNEYDASPHFIYYNRPLVIISIDKDKRLIFSFIYDAVKNIT